MMSRASTHIALGATVMVVAGCTTDRPAPTAVPTAVLRAPIFERHGGTDEMNGHQMRHLATDLSGRNEVPPHVTPASGEAVFHVHNDGSVSYRLFVEDIRNPFMAHIHRAAAGANGDVVVWLFPSTAPGAGPPNTGLRDGLLAEGTFTAKDLVGPLKGGTLAQLLDAIRAGNAYVNVHTSDGSQNFRPGNFPGGEIRGQLGPHPEGGERVDE
jgi:hypothetical protein